MEGLHIFTVSFFGHRQLKDSIEVENRLEAFLRELLFQKEYVEFLVGRDGAFDQLAASTIRRCRREVRDDNSAMILVLPYETAEYKNNQKTFQEYYDEVEICEASAVSHFKAAHQVRNRAMADRSDLVVFYVDHPSGGAYQTLRYVQRSRAQWVNLAEKRI